MIRFIIMGIIYILCLFGTNALLNKYNLNMKHNIDIYAILATIELFLVSWLAFGA